MVFIYLLQSAFLSLGSPTTSPSRQVDLQFGGYMPSSGNSRPSTAPNKRSVHFADELGLDGGDFPSEGKGRPTTAPSRNQRNRTSSFDLESSLDESLNGSFRTERDSFRRATTKKQPEPKQPDPAKKKGSLSFKIEYIFILYQFGL